MKFSAQLLAIFADNSGFGVATEISTSAEPMTGLIWTTLPPSFDATLRVA